MKTFFVFTLSNISLLIVFEKCFSKILLYFLNQFNITYKIYMYIQNLAYNIKHSNKPNTI